MFSETELEFAQKYPFSNTAKKIIKKEDLDLENLPESIKQAAKIKIGHAFSQTSYTPKIIGHKDSLKDEILAFPLAKILISFMPDSLFDKFASSVRETTKNYLQEESVSGKEKKSLEPLLDLAQDLNLKVSIEDEKILSINVTDFLDFVPDKKDLKLVNQQVENGKIFLTLNDFIDFLSEKSFHLVLESLPVDIKQIPLELKKLSKEIYSELQPKFVKKHFKNTGKIKPELFPDCMQNIYSQLMSGKNVSHFGRFAIATFLNQIGMPKENIVQMFSKTPNWNEKTTRYQVEMLSGKSGTEYNAPACDKMRSAGFCTKTHCNEKHPVTYYFNQLKKTSKKEGFNDKRS